MSFSELVEAFDARLKGIRLPDGSIENNESMMSLAEQLLKQYNAHERGWMRFAHSDPKKIKYYRNLVAKGDGWYLLILCWPEQILSPIHDHSGSNCFVKMLQGSLLETRYKMPDQIIDEADKESSCVQMEKIEENLYVEDNVSYMSDDRGLHSMHNPSHSEQAISLHLYFPDFTQCRCFDEATSRSHEGTMVWHTENGIRTEHFGK